MWQKQEIIFLNQRDIFLWSIKGYQNKKMCSCL